MALSAELSPIKYGRLLAKALPRVIETDEEFYRAVDLMEGLDRRVAQGETLSVEEQALLALLERLIQDYDEQVELPKIEPYKVVLFLMEHKGLRQADLLPVFGSRSVASEVLNGKRALSKNHIRKLADFFHLSPEAFL